MATAPNDYAGTAPGVVLATLTTAGDTTVALTVAAGQRVIASASGATGWTGSVLLDRQSNVGKQNWYYTGQALTKNGSGSAGQETLDLVSNTNGDVRLRLSSDGAGPVEVELVVSSAGRADLP